MADLQTPVNLITGAGSTRLKNGGFARRGTIPANEFEIHDNLSAFDHTRMAPAIVSIEGANPAIVQSFCEVAYQRNTATPTDYFLNPLDSSTSSPVDIPVAVTFLPTANVGGGGVTTAVPPAEATSGVFKGGAIFYAKTDAVASYVVDVGPLASTDLVIVKQIRGSIGAGSEVTILTRTNDPNNGQIEVAKLNGQNFSATGSPNIMVIVVRGEIRHGGFLGPEDVFGTATIPAGFSDLYIDVPYITADSVVIWTPTSQNVGFHQGGLCEIKGSRVTGANGAVVIGTIDGVVAPADLSFNYVVLNP